MSSLFRYGSKLVVALLTTTILASSLTSAVANDRALPTASPATITLQRASLPPEAERMRLKQLAHTIGAPRHIDGFSGSDSLNFNRGELAQEISESNARIRANRSIGVVGIASKLVRNPPQLRPMTPEVSVPWIASNQSSPTAGERMFRNGTIRRSSTFRNLASSRLVSATTPSFTGINTYWRYEQGNLPGVGHYMVNVGGQQNLIVQQDDMDVPNKGIDLAFRRTYNSLSQHDYFGTDGSQISNYGDGWTNTFDAHAAYNSGNSYGSGISVFDIDGARYDYMPTSQTAKTLYYQAPVGMAGTVLGICYTYYVCWTKRSGTTYYFYRPDFDTLESGATGYDGRLNAIYGRNSSNFITFGYYFDSSPNTSQNLNKVVVTTEAGQAATLAFSDVKAQSGLRRLLASLTRPDGIAITYNYDANGNPYVVSEPPSSASQSNCAGTIASCLDSVYTFGGSNHLLLSVAGGRQVQQQSEYAYADTQFQWLTVSGVQTGSVSAVLSIGIVNPTISDGYSSGPLQSGYGSTASTYRTVRYTVSGSAVTVSDSDLHQTIYDINPANGLIGGMAQYVSSSDTLDTTYGYDSTNNDLSSETDPRGNETDHAYDYYGNEIASALPQVSTSDGTLRPTSYYSYDAYNNVTAFCDPEYSNLHGMNWMAYPAPVDNLCPSAGGATRMTWTQTAADTYGELTQIETPLGYVRAIAYSPAAQGGADYGLPTSVTGTAISQADGSYRVPTQSFSYDNYGNVMCYSNGQGTFALQYDALNRRTVVADPDDGSIVQCGKTSSSTTTASYTHYYSDGSVSETESPPQHASSGTGNQYTYDADGNRITETVFFAAGAPKTHTKWYDGDDRLVEVDNGVNFAAGWLTRYFYDLSEGAGVSLSGTPTFAAHGGLFGTQVYSSATWQATKGTAFDSIDRIVQEFRWPTVSCGSSCTVVPSAIKSWDASGDSLGLLTSMTDELGEAATMSYDADENITATTYSGDGGVTADQAITYDADSRPHAKTSSKVGSETYSYDLDGRITQAVEPNQGGITSPAILTYDYYGDGLRKDVGVSSSALSASPLFTYSYRVDSQRKQLIANMPDGQHTFNWTETNAGRFLSESDQFGSTTQTYDQFGRPGSRYVPGGSLVGYSYDLQDEPLAFNSFDGEQITRSYDELEEITSETYSPNPSSSSPPNPSQQAYPSYSQAYSLGVAQKIATVSSYSTTYGLISSNVTQGANISGAITVITTQPPTPSMPPPSCPGNTPTWPTGSRQFTYDSAGRETAGVWNYKLEKEVSKGGDPPKLVCEIASGSGTLGQSFDAENHLLTHNENNWESDLSDSLPSEDYSYVWGPNGHPAVGQFSEPGTSVASKSSLHWDGDTLLFDTNASGALEDIKIDGPLGFYSPTYKTQIVERDDSGQQVGTYGASGTAGPYFPDEWNRCAASGSCALGNATVFQYKSLDGITDGPNTFQGVRTQDSTTSQWTTPDAYAGEIEDPMSQRPYVWKNNNPLLYTDPSGYDPGSDVLELGGFSAIANALAEITATTVATVAGGAIAAGASIGGGLVLIPSGLADDTLSGYNAAHSQDTGPSVASDQALFAHSKNARSSTEQKHQQGEARQAQDQAEDGEKGDKRRKPYGKRPKGYKGPYPPKKNTDTKTSS